MTEAITLDGKMEQIKADFTEFEAKAKSLEVTNDEQEIEAITALSGLKARTKRADELRKFFVSPLNAQVKAINAKFKCQTEPLIKIDAIIRQKIKVYGDAKEAQLIKERQEQADKAFKKLEAVQKKAAAEAKKTNKPVKTFIPAEVAPIEAPAQTVRTEAGSATRKKYWTWELEDEKKLRKAHPELFVLDEKEVNKLVKGGTRELEGVRIYQDTRLSIR